MGLKGRYINKDENKAIEIINALKCISKSQLIKMVGFKNGINTIEEKINMLNKYSYDRNAQQFKIVDEYYLAISQEEVDYDMIKCIDVMLELDIKSIKWYSAANYPLKLSFSRKTENQEDTKVFDIAVLNPGEEIIFNKVLSNSFCERLIIILDKKIINQYKPIITDKKIKYCTLEPIEFHDDLGGIK